MNQNEEVPDSLGGLGDMLPADVLKKVNELLEQLHRTDKDHQGSTVIVYAPGSQYVDKQFNFGKTLPGPPCVGREKGPSDLPDVLATNEAMALWEKARAAGYVDDDYQPLISRTQAALLADAMAVRLGIREKWKVFETLWNRTKMYKDYYQAVEQKQFLPFQDRLKLLFG